jgi:6-pyruvoyl-tetrahydropterin synthase
MRVRLTKDFQFEAAQTLPKAPEGHKCRKMHGHSFKVEISVEGETNPETGWVYDHAQISDADEAAHSTARPFVSERNRGFGKSDY